MQDSKKYFLPNVERRWKTVHMKLAQLNLIVGISFYLMHKATKNLLSGVGNNLMHKVLKNAG